MRAIADRSLSLSMRCYRGLIRAYPQAFLTEFEDLLCQAFGDLAHRAVRTKGVLGLLALWTRTVPDLISSALSQRFQPNSDWRFRLRWIAGCAAGALLGVAFMFVVMSAVGKIELLMGIAVSRQRPRSVESFNILVLQLTAAFGLGVGWFQALVIGWKRPRRAAWIMATMIGATSAAGILLLAPFIYRYLQVTIHPWRLLVDHHPMMYYGGGAVFCVSVMGMLQTLVLGRRNPRALTWTPVSAIGILTCSFVTAAIGNPVLRNFHRSLAMYGVLGLIVGTVYGLLTVLPLEWILQPGRARDAVQDGSTS
jgi:MFS family permease